MNSSPVVMLVGLRARRHVWAPLGAAPRPKRTRELDLPTGPGQGHLNLRVGELHLRQRQHSFMDLSAKAKTIFTKGKNCHSRFRAKGTFSSPSCAFNIFKTTVSTYRHFSRRVPDSCPDTLVTNEVNPWPWSIHLSTTRQSFTLATVHDL